MDREQRLAAAKKKLNIYKQQQAAGQGQPNQHTPPPDSAAARRPSNPGNGNANQPSPSSSSGSSYAGQISPAIQAQANLPAFNGSGPPNGLNGGHHNEYQNGNQIAFAQHQHGLEHQHHQQPNEFPGAGIVHEHSSPIQPPAMPMPLPLDVPPQQLDLLDSNTMQPNPTAHFDLLDSNTLPPHSVAAQSSPGAGGLAGVLRDIAETHQHQQHQRQSSSGSNRSPPAPAQGHIINHDIIADLNPSYQCNNDLLAFSNALPLQGPSALPDVASGAPAPAAVTPGLIEDSQPYHVPVARSQSIQEMEQEMVDRVNQQGPSSPNAVPPPAPPDNDLVATTKVNSDIHPAEPSTSAPAHSPRDRPRGSGSGRTPVNLYPMPTFRRSAHPSGESGSSLHASAADHSADAAASAITTEVYELQLSQLRSDNAHLQQRESDLVAQLQQVEITIQGLRKERDDLRHELRAEDTPSLKGKLSTLYEEIAGLQEKIRKLELQLDAAYENVNRKVDSYNELEQALIVINKGKMELAAKLDVECEAGKELRHRFEDSQHQLAKISERNMELETILSSHQLQLERLSSLEAEMVQMKRKYAGAINHSHDHGQEDSHDHSHEHEHEHEKYSDNSSHHLHHELEHEHNAECNHEHEHKDDHHDHDHGHSHSHSHEDHDHSHDHSHEHHDHDHSHDHDHNGDHHANASRPHEDPNSVSAMQKKLARLEWENSSFREEIDRLAELLQAKTVDANLLTNYKEDNERLKSNLNQAEHLVVQLSSENETIGDYIALYQTQRLALKERAREKENELATLSIEREKLRAQMEQLNQLLQAYHCKLEQGTAASEIESNAKQINELVLGINSTFNPCSACSGSRLMNV